MVCQGSLGVRGRGVLAIISPKPIGTLRKRIGLGNYAPYVGWPAKITRRIASVLKDAKLAYRAFAKAKPFWS